jgi:rRNA small subunit pseudouridine methyltransferase Nep1
MSLRRRHSHSSPRDPATPSIPSHVLSRKRSESLEGLNGRNIPPKPASAPSAISTDSSDEEDTFSRGDKMDADSPPLKKSTLSSPLISERPTKPMPSRRLANQAQSVAPSPIKPDQSTSLPPKPLIAMSKSHQQLTNPSLIPAAPQLPRTPAEKDSKRRLIVVLENACLEAYKISSGSAGRSGGQGGRKDAGKDAKYALLNCDDHQGILAKTGRDIADARPDITHQVRLLLHSSCSDLPDSGVIFLCSASLHCLTLP